MATDQLTHVEGKQVNIRIDQGGTVNIAVTLKTYDDGYGTLVPIDLTDYTIRAKIRRNFSDTTSIIDFTTTITDPLLGKLALTLTAAQTAGLTTTSTKRVAQLGYWDLEIESLGGIVTRCLEGEVYLSQESSK